MGTILTVPTIVRNNGGPPNNGCNAVSKIPKRGKPIINNNFCLFN